MRERIDRLYNIIQSDKYDDYLEDKEYEYIVEDKICQKKGLMGYRDFKIDFRDPNEIMQRINANINEFVQFCNKYGISYNVSETEEYSSDCHFTGGVKGRVKTVKKEIIFTVTSNVRQKLIHEKCTRDLEKTKEYFISQAGDWYYRMKTSEAVMDIAEKMYAFVNAIKADRAKEAEAYYYMFYKCDRFETCVKHLLGQHEELSLKYEELGYENLGSEEQCAAVTAALLSILEEKIKSDPEIFDINASESAEYSRIDSVLFTIILRADEVEAKKKQLKSW